MTPSSAALNSNTVFLVDDHQSILQFCCKRLEQTGSTMVTALDGVAVIDMMSRPTSDIVMPDLMRPKVHGLEVLEAVCADIRYNDMPVRIGQPVLFARSANVEVA